MRIVHLLHTLNNEELKPARLELLTRRLPMSMQSQLRKFRRWQDYQASLFGKLLLQEGLANVFGMDSQALEEIVVTENRKPILPGSELFFSISHSGDLVACAIGNVPLGIDVERVRSVEAGELMKFLPVITPGKDVRKPDFFETWTMAEAVLKASGEGLRHSMSDVTIDTARQEATFRSKQWSLSPLHLRDGYRGYIATALRAVVVTEFQPPFNIASLTHNDEKGLEHESLYGL